MQFLVKKHETQFKLSNLALPSFFLRIYLFSLSNHTHSPLLLHLFFSLPLSDPAAAIWGGFHKATAATAVGHAAT